MYIDCKNGIDEKLLKQVADDIKRGKIAVFPTETVYGIGTNGLDENAVNKIYDIKKRPRNKSISLLVSDMEMCEALAQDITDAEYKLMNAFFPGPLTIILKKKKIVPDIVTAGGDYVGIRMPQGEIARKLVELAGVPIAAPSANISGEPSGISIEKPMKDFEGKVDYFIDGGESTLKQSSTVVKMEDGIPVILRQGAITRKQIVDTIK